MFLPFLQNNPSTDFKGKDLFILVSQKEALWELFLMLRITV